MSMIYNQEWDRYCAHVIHTTILNHFGDKLICSGSDRSRLYQNSTKIPPNYTKIIPNYTQIILKLYQISRKSSNFSCGLQIPTRIMGGVDPADWYNSYHAPCILFLRNSLVCIRSFRNYTKIILKLYQIILNFQKIIKNQLW